MASIETVWPRRCALDQLNTGVRPPPMAAPRQGLHPRPPGGRSPPRYGLDGQQRPPPSCRPGRRGRGRWTRTGYSSARSAAEGGTVAATCYPCPMLRHSVSRSRSTPTSPRRGARRTHPHGGHLRALISRYSRPQGTEQPHRPRPRCRRHRRLTPRRLSAWGCRKPKAAQATGRSAGWPKFEGRVRPLGGLIIISTSSRSEDVRREEPPFPSENSLFNGSKVDP